MPVAFCAPKYARKAVFQGEQMLKTAIAVLKAAAAAQTTTYTYSDSQTLQLLAGIVAAWAFQQGSSLEQERHVDPASAKAT